MATSQSYTAEENDHVSAATDDMGAQAATQEEDTPRNPQEEDAAAKLAIASMNERHDANDHNLEGAAELESGSLNGTSPDEAAAEPSSTSMDPSSDVNKGTPQEEDAAAVCTSASIDKISDTIKNAHVDVLAKGIATVLGPVMNDFDGGVEGAFKSQSILASSIDRLTRELDKLLEDVPLPFATQHATRLSGIRKRILTLNSSLRIIQRRMDTIQRFRAGYASKVIAKDNQERASMENSHSRAVSLMEVLPTKGTSSSSADDKKNDGGQLSKLVGTEISDKFGNIQSEGSQGNNVQERLISKNLHGETRAS